MVTRLAAPAPTSNYAAYRECCAEQAALPAQEWTFKRDPRYRRILEHVTPEQGAIFAEVARETAADRWGSLRAMLPALVAENDRYGAPIPAAYPTLGITCSPSNLRYFCQAVQVWSHAARLGLRDLAIAELGGGYGGLALYVHRLAPRFPCGLRGYTLVDLPEAAALQRAYCAALALPVDVRDGLDPAFSWESSPAAYLVSAYAFSEFDRDTHAWYRERLVRRCPHGFVVWNFAAPLHGFEKPLGGPLYAFVDAPLTVVAERPATGAGNVVVTW